MDLVTLIKGKPGASASWGGDPNPTLFLQWLHAQPAAVTTMDGSSQDNPFTPDLWLTFLAITAKPDLFPHVLPFFPAPIQAASLELGVP